MALLKRSRKAAEKCLRTGVLQRFVERFRAACTECDFGGVLSELDDHDRQTRVITGLTSGQQVAGSFELEARSTPANSDVPG